MLHAELELALEVEVILATLPRGGVEGQLDQVLAVVEAYPILIEGVEGVIDGGLRRRLGLRGERLLLSGPLRISRAMGEMVG